MSSMEVEPSTSVPNNNNNNTNNSDNRVREAAREIFNRFYKQLTVGCGNNSNHNPQCRSDPSFSLGSGSGSVDEIKKKCLELLKAKAKPCPALTPAPSQTKPISTDINNSNTSSSSNINNNLNNNNNNNNLNENSSISASSSITLSPLSTPLRKPVSPNLQSNTNANAAMSLEPPQSKPNDSPSPNPNSNSLSPQATAVPAPAGSASPNSKPLKVPQNPLSIQKFKLLFETYHNIATHKETHNNNDNNNNNNKDGILDELMSEIKGVFSDPLVLNESFDQPNNYFTENTQVPAPASAPVPANAPAPSQAADVPQTQTSNSMDEEKEKDKVNTDKNKNGDDNNNSSSKLIDLFSPIVLNLSNLDLVWEHLLNEDDKNSSSIRQSLLSSFKDCIQKITNFFATHKAIDKNNHALEKENMQNLRCLLIIMECPLFLELESYEALKLLCKLFGSLSDKNKTQIIKWYVEWPSERLERLVVVLQQYITVSYYIKVKLQDMLCAAKVLGLFYTANNDRSVKYAGIQVLSHTLWYNDVVNNGDLKLIAEDFEKWKRKVECFANYSFLMDAATKSSFMRFDAQLQMRRHFQEAAIQSIFTGTRASPFLVLRVRRDHLIPDTLAQLQANDEWEYKKPLKVVFQGESGIDEGGLRKEFFQLIVQQIFDPKYGMVIVDSETKTYKFNPLSFESSQEFELIGIVVGLAIYNSIILDLHLDHYIYKLLLGEKPSFFHLQQTYPALAKGLKQLLEFDGDVESTFMRNFTVELDVFGEMVEHELKKGGKDIPLTNQNRQEYVDLYVEWKLEKQFEKQFKSFKQGFLSVCGGEALKLFRAEELELLICGSEALDFDALQTSTRYEEGFTSSTPIIKHFWDIVKSMSDDHKRKFLFFCTGSDRVPIKGLGATQFTIIRKGPDSDQLPESHTCFNQLVFPEYASKEKLEKLLYLALEHAHGFGLI